jgi:hypothetical protein
MAVTVAAVGLIIVLIGAFGLLRPSAIIGFASRTGSSRSGFVSSVSLRAVLGLVFLWAAPNTRLPRIVSAVGVLSFLAAVGLVLIGHSRMQRFIHRWTAWPAWFVRLTLLLLIGFGALLIYAAA